MAAMGCGKDKATKLFRELDQSGIGLIERRKQGQGRPARIYVKNFVLPPEPDRPPPDDFQTADNKQSKPLTGAAVQNAEIARSGSGQNSSQETAFSAPIKTDKNKTDLSDTESPAPYTPSPPRRWLGEDRRGRLESYRAIIRKNISYDILLRDYGCNAESIDSYVDLMAETCSGTRETVRINQEDLPADLVRSRPLSLDMTHIVYVQDFMSQNKTPVRNIRAYTLSVLYNAPTAMDQYYATQVNRDLELGWGVTHEYPVQ